MKSVTRGQICREICSQIGPGRRGGGRGVRTLGDPGKGAQQKRETASIGLGGNELDLSYIYKQNLGGRTWNLHISPDCL